ncbi:DUF2087 domain-containing protein [Paenibacillus eucommiae]|uniref:DUF2087 domain-containing protein n=1 Tax=Paenibacillus eucommiae TaxID=1355755 RepID=A0ABS4INK8_9BACL|nr:DUF2087 domain-containing protein [Paenibacillus eucommiae]MBP1989098.1 hypothetical protein [Paenibacillus eucommiae]
MNDLSERFWGASVEEMKQGYVYEDNAKKYICLVCGKEFEKGIIYREGDTYYEAEKFASVHVSHEHISMFEYLIGLNKKLTGLTDLQKNLLEYFYKGYSDSEIVKLEGGSASTIRNHRFTFREKEKQAKVFLTIMELVEASQPQRPRFVTIHKSATVVDERFNLTEEENEEILNTYFPVGREGKLSTFPKREKRKVALLKHIIGKFEIDRKYTEHEINEVLKAIYDDYVTLRRYLIEYGFMDRLDDCSSYWVKV